MNGFRLPLAPLLGGVLGAACGEPDGTRLPGLEARPVPAVTSVDYALSFERDQQYATTANAYFPIAKASQSISAWVKPARQDVDEAFFTMRRGIESGTMFGFSQGRLTAWSVWGMRIFAQADSSVVPDRWYHVAHVQTQIDDAADIYEQRLYLNGELVAEGEQPPQS
ncbi:MAG TPA: LamG-like jellyroll fold domain-containing protein, partial [Polyangiaceae bacterium]